MAPAETKRTSFFEKAISTLPAFLMMYFCVARCFVALAGLLAAYDGSGAAALTWDTVAVVS